MALLALFHLKIAVTAAFVVIKDFLLSFLNITPNSCVFNTFSTRLTANTSGSNISAALIKDKNPNLDLNIEFMDSNQDFDNNNNDTQRTMTTSSASCASLCAVFKDKLS